MSPFKKAAMSSTLFVLGALSAPGASAQSSDPAWIDDLSMQLKSEIACEPNLYINIREGKIATNKYYEARVQCVDGRMFDATRTEPEKVFTIRACGVAVC